MPRLIFSLATPDDDDALRRLLRENVMEGGISVSFRREPSYFLTSSVQGEQAEIYKGCNVETGEIAVLGSRFRRAAYFNGKRETLGYLADLRLNRRYRSGFHLLSTYKELCRIMAADPLPLHTSMILHDNAAALSTIAANRPGMPRYIPQGLVHTPFIRLARPRRPIAPEGVELRFGRAGEEGVLTDFLNREAARRQFAPHYEPADWHNGRLRGLSVGDVCIARRDGRIVGALAGWDQHGFRQIHVERYNGLWRLGKPLYNAAARLLRLPLLPDEGGTIRYGYLALTAVEKDDADVYRALLRAQYIRCRKLGWHYMVGSMHENDPLLPVMNEYPHLAAGGRLFVVAFDTPPEPDGRVPYVEAATL